MKYFLLVFIFSFFSLSLSASSNSKIVLAIHGGTTDYEEIPPSLETEDGVLHLFIFDKETTQLLK